MSVKVVHEGYSSRDTGGILEDCCICDLPTPYWYGTGALNVPLCQWCAAQVSAEHIPTREQLRIKRKRAEKKPNFGAPW